MGVASVRHDVSAQCSMNSPTDHGLKRCLLGVSETRHPHGLHHLSPPLTGSFTLTVSEESGVI